MIGIGIRTVRTRSILPAFDATSFSGWSRDYSTIICSGNKQEPPKLKHARISSTSYARRNIHQTSPVHANKKKLSSPPASASQKNAGGAPLVQQELFVSCLPGLEPILSAELTALGYPNHELLPTGGGVTLKTKSLVDTILACHLYLGTASEVFVKCGPSFSARTLPELRRKSQQAVPWAKLFNVKKPTTTTPDDKKKANNKVPIPISIPLQIQMRVTTKKSKLYHTGAIEERILAGIHDALGYDGDDTSLSSSKHAPAVKLTVKVVRDQVEMFLHTSSTPLHKRGYRLQTAKAPLREDLAYALLWSAGWKPSYDRSNTTDDSQTPSQPPAPPSFDALVDPFCGSGTIAIEAAAMQLGLPPGRLRPAPFVAGMHIDKTQKRWSRMLLEQTGTIPSNHGNDAGSPTSRKTTIVASDRDLGAIQAAKGNAERAGVLEVMDIQHAALSSNPMWQAEDEDPLNIEDEEAMVPKKSPSKRVLVATNPPYGKRISARNKGPSSNKEGAKYNVDPLLPLYQRLTHLVNELGRGGQEKKNKTHSKAAILTHDPRLLRQAGMSSLKPLFKSTHGGVRVTVVSYSGGSGRAD